MLGAIWLYLLALALPCWAYPSGHLITCEEFGRGTSFDPRTAVGEWFNVYCLQGESNLSENIIIRELNSSQLQQYDEILRRYSKDKLKLEFKIHDSHPFGVDSDAVLVPQDDAGNVDAWVTHLKIGDTDLPMPDYVPCSIKWKGVDGFLVMMLCSSQKVFVLSKTATPDENQLKRVVDNLNNNTIPSGDKIYSSLLTLL